MSVLPSTIKPAGPVLIVGAGGGFDFMCGLPIAFELEEARVEVILGNYSFTDLSNVEGAQPIAEGCLRVDADSYLSSGDYFPEKFYCEWHRERRGCDTFVYCFSRQGVQPLLRQYEALIAKHSIDTVICIDGGVDGIFRGDEHDLGTPSMDSISVIATSLCKARSRIYCCTAFGTEGAEGKVSHAQALNRMSDLLRKGSSLGVGMALSHTGLGKQFRDAAETTFSKMPPIKRSIVVSTILASMSGRFGPTRVTQKTSFHEPWISPLQSLFWYFDAEPVARMKLFYEAAVQSKTVADVSSAIDQERKNVDIKGYESIPI